ncbi:c-type cytochrome [Roseovarius pelagicus]|uniref:C-type cytochrome n=1 Tax=Roseovarius pelagicus TaxID=2980108 RepID=A0ABY6DFY0_9RHOB|nr:c-type cytochrome [Roseovarius pelagicus]UXX84955.1 c-type cytochrome [Roseovarius pelagicus]
MARALAIAILFATPLAAQDFFTLKGHGGPIMDIAVSPAGQIATASFDNSVGLWDQHDPIWLEGHAAAVNAVAFRAEDFVVSAGDDFQAWLWSARAREGRQIVSHTAKVMDVALAPDGMTIATASWDSTIGLTTIDTRNDVALSNWQIVGRKLTGHRSGVNAVAFSQDGETLYSASMDGTIRSWQSFGSQPTSNVIVKHGFGVNELIVNQAAGWLAYGAVDGGTRIIDLTTGEEIADFTLERRPILAMAFDPVGKQLAVGDGEGFIMLVNTERMEITHDFRAARQGPIWALAFSPDGQNIHAGGIEDIVYSWPVATMTEHGPMTGKQRSFLADPETLSNGERQFKRKCSICHTLEAGSARKAGPSLHALFGRKAGTVSDYVYSDTLDRSEIIWSAETINALFDLGPDHFIPGTKMPMQRIVKQADRDDLIDYLRTQTVQGED